MVTILSNQSLFDISIRYTGTIENAFKIAVANGLSLTAELEPGAQLIIPADVEMNNDVISYFAAKRIQPATGFEYAEIEVTPELEGISYWIINKNFIVQ